MTARSPLPQSAFADAFLAALFASAQRQTRSKQPIALPIGEIDPGELRQAVISLEFRITAEAVVDAKRRKKPKGLIAKEQRVASAELDLARYAGGQLDDPLPF